jgi:hypothetical protein
MALHEKSRCRSGGNGQAHDHASVHLQFPT